ncbi:hypothetical protein J3454_14410 [Erythrobacter sp. NFXS35]|uniref:hypothetical protein n=1 Tax=Erythrobacter sp. NFXS35 TaxID=2818436 RepID=UPI0032DF5DB8
MARQDVIIRMRLAGEDFDREFKAKFSDLEDAADRQSLAAGSRSGGSFMKGFLGSAGIAALGTAIGVAINSAADLGSEIASTSRQFNIGAEELQIWRQAASNAGVTASQFDGSLSSLTQKIGEANAGNRAAQQSFVDLGIGFATTAGQARATDAVMLDLVQRIAAIEDPSERARLGTQLLGDEFKTLHPLLLEGADGFNAAAAEIDRFGGALSAEEIRKLDETNRKIEEMKNQLSRSVAKVVADNADSINALADSLFNLADASIKATGDFITFLNTQARYDQAVAALPRGLTGEAREGAMADLDRRFGRRETVTSTALGGLIKFKDVRFQPGVESDWAGPGGYLSRLANDQADAAAPTVTGTGSTRRGGGSRRNPTQSAAEKEAERAAKEAIRNEEQLRDALARTLRTQEDSAAVQRIRSEQGEVAAAAAEAELAFLRQHPLAVNDTVEALAAALGITRELTQADKDRLQLLIDQGDAAEAAAGSAAATKAQAEFDRELARQEQEAQRLAERQAEFFRQAHERAIFDVANIYETAMRGGVDDLWDHFKDEGFRMIAEVAAQWTLAMISGQGFDFNAAAGQAFGRSPLSSIFFGAGGGAANDNGATMSGFGGGIFGIGGGLPSYITGSPIMQGGGGISGAAVRATLGPQAKAQGLQNTGFDLALGGIAGSLVGGGGMAGQLGGMIGSAGGQALGSSIGALGAFGGPVGAIVGGILGSVLPSLLSSTKRGSVNIGNAGGTLGITGSRGNSSSREATAAGGANSLIDSIFQIAEQLGGSVDASRGSVSLGVRDNNFRVDTSGSGITKTRNGAIDFGQDQEAAMRFAIQDLIKDGVITGISQASQNLLQGGGDLEAQIEKALMIEAVPRLLRERLDPLGAQLDVLYDKFKALADAMREGGASAEQVAEAQRLWELEKADAISSIGAASQTLADFLSSLNAGSNSPLSLREQRAEAEQQLAPFLAQITDAEAARAEVERLRAGGASASEVEAAEAAARAAAAAIDQSGFTQASQLLLSISRQGNASSGAFFSDFDRIRELTGSAIGFVDQASARDADNRDPFSQAIAKNTEDAAYILSDVRSIMQAVNDNIAVLVGGGYGSGGGYTRQPRGFTA